MSISFPVHPPSSTKLYSSRSGCLLLPSQAQCLLLSFSTSLLGDMWHPCAFEDFCRFGYGFSPETTTIIRDTTPSPPLVPESSFAPCSTLCISISLVAQSCLTLCDPTDCSTPGLPVHHQHPKPAQTHVLSSWWCLPTISASVVPFSSCLQFFPASESFPVS